MREAHPWPGGVWIPSEELRSRQHELPPPAVAVRVGRSAKDSGVEQILRSLAREIVWVDEGQHAVSHLWLPSEFVIEQCASHLPEGARVVDLGCGVGRDAVALANLGFRVTALDRLSDAIVRARSLEEAYRIKGHPIDWRVGDYRIDEGEQFDAAILAWTFDRTGYEAILRWVRPGGLLVAQSFSEHSHRMLGHPILNRCLFDHHGWPGLEQISYAEAEVLGKHAACVIGKKLGE